MTQRFPKNMFLTNLFITMASRYHKKLFNHHIKLDTYCTNSLANPFISMTQRFPKNMFLTNLFITMTSTHTIKDNNNNIVHF